MRIPRKTYEVPATWIMYLAGACMALFALFVMASVAMRYALALPIFFTEELVGLLFMTMAFLTWPYAAATRSHIRIDALAMRYGPRARRFWGLVSAAAVLVFAAVFGMRTYEFMALSYQLGGLSDVSKLVLWPWMAVMPLSTVLFGLVVLLQAWNTLFAPEDPDAGLPG